MNTADRIRMYIALREHKKAADTEYKKSMERVNQAMEKLEAELLADMEASGETSKKVKGVGTAYIYVSTSMTTESREALLRGALAKKNLDMLDIRPNKTIVNEMISKGEVVPGVKITQTRLIGVRKGD